ncbi:MAG: hypothetical protein R6U70_00700 [Bacillota bacterium]
MRRESSARSYLTLILLLLIGAFVGNVVGEVASPHVPVLSESAALGFSPVTLRLLNTLDFSIGMNLNLSLLGAIGAGFGVLLWRK